MTCFVIELIRSSLAAVSPLLVGISTLVTAVATVFIAVYTQVNREMVSVQKKSLESQRFENQNAKSPILVLVKPAGNAGKENTGETTIWFPKLVIKNVGFGPALNVNYTSGASPEHIRPLGVHEDIEIHLKAPKEKAGQTFRLSENFFYRVSRYLRPPVEDRGFGRLDSEHHPSNVNRFGKQSLVTFNALLSRVIFGARSVATAGECAARLCYHDFLGRVNGAHLRNRIIL